MEFPPDLVGQIVLFGIKILLLFGAGCGAPVLGGNGVF